MLVLLPVVVMVILWWVVRREDELSLRTDSVISWWFRRFRLVVVCVGGEPGYAP
jgi:hypothetical protein